jgi:hypothetical protein
MYLKFWALSEMHDITIKNILFRSGIVLYNILESFW